VAGEYEYDVLVIGSGPGGYVAAIRASQLKLKAAVVERDKIGGVCLNIGCIPSKALIHQAEMFSHIKDLEAMGLKVDKSGFDYGVAFRKSRTAADRLSKGVAFLLKKNNVEVIVGTGRVAGPHEVVVEGAGAPRTVRAKNILIATGSRPREIPGFKIDEQRVLSSTGMLMMEKLPRSLLILGAGAIGAEFAYVMNAFGVQVHLVEMLPQVLPLEDSETAAVLAKDLAKRGVTIAVDTKAVAMAPRGADLEVTLEGKDGKRSTVAVEKILVAVGRAPNTENLGLEKVGVKLDRGFVTVGDYYQTAVPSVYAIGDVVPTPLLAHVASKEGEIAVEHMAGHKPPKKVDLQAIPSAVYTEPQVASFGPTEEKAKASGIKYKKSSFPYRGAGKAVAVEQVDGMVKILTDPATGEILAAHIVGSNATELIHEILLAKTAELLPADISTMIHAHPTLSEAVMEGMRAVEGWVIHV
jgi:dihydrolipoamide dehydrogenase